MLHFIHNIIFCQLQRMFTVDERTGIIRTQSQLSRDTAAQVSFVAEARDVRAVDPPPIHQTATGKLFYSRVSRSYLIPFFWKNPILSYFLKNVLFFLFFGHFAFKFGIL